MRSFTRMVLLVVLLLLPARALRAQAAVDPSGHWEGTVQAPNMEVRVEIDLAKNSKGELAGTFGNPAQRLRGLPLSKVAVEGKSVRFQIGRVAGERTFEGALSADGKSISGTYSQSGGSVPFSLTRTGDPRIEAAAKSAPIGRELEGTWNGTLAVDGKQLRFVLTMSNEPDGTATGSIVNLDEGELEIPVSTITQAGSNLTLDFKTVGGSYAGALNKEGTELVGTYSQGAFVAPLTFRLAKP